MTTPCGPGMTGNMGGVVPQGVVMLAGSSSGKIYSNIVRDPHNSNTNGTMVSLSAGNAGTITFFNNLIYGTLSSGVSLLIEYQNAADTNIYNNSIYQNNSTYPVGIRSQTGTSVLKNNIIYQAGSGNCGEMVYHSTEPLHEYNKYYYPSGSAPEWGADGPGETTGEPGWVQVPSGTYDPNDAALAEDSASRGQATPLTIFTDSFNGISRSQDNSWDLGMFEWSKEVSPPSNLRILTN